MTPCEESVRGASNLRLNIALASPVKDTVIGSGGFVGELFESVIRRWSTEYSQSKRAEKQKVLEDIYSDFVSRGGRVFARDTKNRKLIIQRSKGKTIDTITRAIRKRVLAEKKKEEDKADNEESTPKLANANTKRKPKLQQPQARKRSRWEEVFPAVLREEETLSNLSQADDEELFDFYLEEPLEHNASDAPQPTALQSVESGTLSMMSGASTPIPFGELFADFWDSNSALERGEASNFVSPETIPDSSDELSVFDQPPKVPFKPATYAAGFASAVSDLSVNSETNKNASQDGGDIVVPPFLSSFDCFPNINSPANMHQHQPYFLGHPGAFQMVPPTRLTPAPPPRFMPTVVSPSTSTVHLQGKVAAAVTTPPPKKMPAVADKKKTKKRLFTKKGPSPASLQVLPVMQRGGTALLAPMPPKTVQGMSEMIQKFILLEEKARVLQHENEQVWKRLETLEQSMESQVARKPS